MKVNKILGYIGVGLFGASCTMKTPSYQKALEHASKYLKGTEIFIAEKKSVEITYKELNNCSEDIFYWDSLLSVNREKEYNELGKKHILDSVNGIYNRKPLFRLPIEIKGVQKGKNIIDSIKSEVAKYYSGSEFLKLEKNAPMNSYENEYGTSDNIKTHYFGLIGIKGAERKGFKDGLREARNELKN